MKIIKKPKEFNRTVTCHQVVDEYGRYWNKKEEKAKKEELFKEE